MFHSMDSVFGIISDSISEGALTGSADAAVTKVVCMMFGSSVGADSAD